MSAETMDCDFVVVGLGPTGLMATAYLAQKGYRVVAIEKHEAMYGLPRAGHVDHEIVRFLQELGVEDRFLPDAFAISSYRWFNAEGQTLLEMDWGGLSVSGYNSDFMMYQPVLEDALVAAFESANPPPRVLRGFQVTAISQDGGGVSVSAQRSSADGKGGLVLGEETLTVRGAWLLAADGARSGIREWLNIGRRDFGFNETALDLDVRVKRPLPHMDPHQVCDPRRSVFISPLGKRHHRFEWVIRPDEDPNDFAQPAKAWALLADKNIGPDDVEIVRQQLYTFEARVAERWRDGRILLLGDAAHTMPPFMGQGACSGMRDSVNLVWKLDLVTRGIAPETLIDSYQVEREPHTSTWIELSMRTGEVACTLDVEKAAKRDALLLSGEVPPMPTFPGLTTGILDLTADQQLAEPVGFFFPQRPVTLVDRSGPFDDIAGRGFLLVTVDTAMTATLSELARAFLGRIGARIITVSESPSAEAIGDPESFYADWFSRHGIVAVIVRPDYYVYGVARRADDVDGLVARLRDALTGGSSASAKSTGRESIDA